MTTFTGCADELQCATLSGSNGITISTQTSPNKIVISTNNLTASNISGTNVYTQEIYNSNNLNTKYLNVALLGSYNDYAAIFNYEGDEGNTIYARSSGSDGATINVIAEGPYNTAVTFYAPDANSCGSRIYAVTGSNISSSGPSIITTNNVSIGTGSNNFRLHVAQGAATEIARFENIVSNIEGFIRVRGGGDFSDAYLGSYDGTGFVGTSTATTFCIRTDDQNRIFIDDIGRMGIGVTSPSYELQLSTDSAAKPSTNTWTITSDIRVKENIQNYTKGLETIIQLVPVTYDYNGKAGFEKIRGNIGIIAQDVLNILPESISTYQAKLNEEDTEKTELYNFNSHALTYVMINSIKQLKQENDELKQTLNDLLAKIVVLENK